MCSGKYGLGNSKWNHLLQELNTDGKPVVKYMRGQPNKENTVGYCTNKKHKGALTVRMIKQHHCLENQCVFFRKCEEHQYWQKREETRKKRKQENKQQGNTQGTKVTKTGSGGFRKSSLRTNEFSGISKFFENQQVYYLYTFAGTPESIIYVNGFYSLDSIMSWMESHVCNYYLVAYQEDDNWKYTGYRKNNLGGVNEIDLTWGVNYPKLLLFVACDLAVKVRYNLL